MGLQEQFDDFKADQKKILSAVDEMKLAIKGNKAIGFKGIITQLEEHQEYIEGQKKFKWMAAGVILLASLLLTTIANKLFS